MSSVVRLSNLSGPLCNISVELSWTVADLKISIARVLGVPRWQQRLLSGPNLLIDQGLLKDVLCDNEVTLIRLRFSEEAEQWIKNVRQNGQLYNAPHEMRKDPEVVLAAMHADVGALAWASSELLGNRDFASTVAACNGVALNWLPAFQDDRSIVLAAVRQNAQALEYASNSLQDCREFIREAIGCSRGRALLHARAQMQEDRDLVEAAMVTNWILFQGLVERCPKWREDRAVTRAAVSSHGCALEFASGALRADREIVELAVQTSRGSALRAASEDLRSDRDLVLAAVRLDACALRYAATAICADRDVVLESVRQNGNMLRFASPELRADREVVQAALGQAGSHILSLAAKEVADDFAAEMEVFDVFA